MSSPIEAPAAPHSASYEVLTAARNAVKLGVSLIGQWGVALWVQLFLPRLLGPSLFGELTFAEALTAGAFVFLGAGVETYIRKEVPVRPAHAREFFGGMLILRLLLAAVVVGGLTAFMAARALSPEVRELVYVLALAQFLVITNSTIAALLHAVGKVDGLSVINVASKLVWGAGIAVALWLAGRFGAPVSEQFSAIRGVALATALAEALKLLPLLHLAKRHLGLSWSVRLRPAAVVFWASLPFFVNEVAYQLIDRVSITMLGSLASSDEVGWFGAMSKIAGLSFLLSPLISWVLLPLMSRAHARSREELNALLRRSLEVILTFAMALSLVLGVGADIWVGLISGPKYAPAVLTLQILAPSFVLTYLAMVGSTYLIQIGRSWLVTVVSLIALALNPVLVSLLVSFGRDAFGTGGASAGVAMALIASEMLVTGLFLAFMGRAPFDARNVSMLVKTTVACAVVIAVDVWLRGRAEAELAWMPWLRVAVGASLYLGLLFGTRAVRARELIDFVKQVVRQKSVIAS